METVPSRELLTKTRWSLGVIARKRGSSPTEISVTFRFSSPKTAMTETESLSGFTTQTERSLLVMAIGLDEVGKPFKFFGSAFAIPDKAIAHRATAARPRGPLRDTWFIKLSLLVACSD